MLQAYHEMAKFLTRQCAMLANKDVVTEPPEQLEEEFSRPIKKLKGLVQGAALTEQVHSLISSCSSLEDQVCTAYQEWALQAACVPALHGR